MAKRGRHLESENERLRSDLESREAKVHQLDERLIEVHQLRQDAVKRIDDLISRIDQIGDHLEAQRESRRIDSLEPPPTPPVE